MKTWIKNTIILLVISMLLGLCACAGAKTTGEIVGDLVFYPRTDGTYAVGAYAKNLDRITSLTVPAQHNGKDVTAIAKSGFANATALKQVTLPQTVRSIQSFAFSNCSRLESVTLNEGLGQIDAYAFSGCHSLAQAILPDSVVSLDEHAYSFCTSLKTVKLSEKMDTLKAYTFYRCDSLKEISIPDTVMLVEAYALESCEALLELKIGNGIQNFNFNVVKNCYALEKITVSEGNTVYYSVDGVLYNKLTDEIFFVPANLSGEITIPQGVMQIKASTFSNRKSLTGVTLSGSVVYVGSSAFVGCDALEKVVVEKPNGWYCENQPVKASILSNPKTAAEYFLDKMQINATYRGQSPQN